MTVLATGMDGANEHASGLALFAPGVYVTTPSGEPYLDNITIPVLLVSGAVDCGMNALEKQAQRAFDAFASERKFLVVPKGANHCQWTDPTKDPAHGICKSLVETECHGIEIGVQHDLANRLVRTFTTAFARALSRPSATASRLACSTTWPTVSFGPSPRRCMRAQTRAGAASRRTSRQARP